MFLFCMDDGILLRRWLNDGGCFYYGRPYHYYGCGLSLLLLVMLVVLLTRTAQGLAGAKGRVQTVWFEPSSRELRPIDGRGKRV